MAASTLLRLLKPCLLSLREHLGGIMQIFPHHDVDMWGRVWMRLFRGAWQSLNFDKEYLFGFETLVFATSGILSMHNQLVTLQRERKTWNRIIWPFNEHVNTCFEGLRWRVGEACLYYNIFLLQLGINEGQLLMVHGAFTTGSRILGVLWDRRIGVGAIPVFAFWFWNMQRSCLFNEVKRHK